MFIEHNFNQFIIQFIIFSTSVLHSTDHSFIKRLSCVSGSSRSGLACVLTLVYREMQLLSIATEAVFPGHFSL